MNLRALAESILETPLGYAINQKIGKPTVDRYLRLIAEEVPRDRTRSLLDLGCGIGGFRRSLTGSYTGIDINPEYVATARARFPDARFEVADATALPFASDSFDESISIATAHHLDDEQLTSMIAEALRVTRPSGHFHLIDPVLPTTPNVAFKSFFFSLDRGRFPRAAEQLSRVIASLGVAIIRHRLVAGPLHDVAFFKIARSHSAIQLPGRSLSQGPS
jgi:SAM-dependent methyltransferase